MQDNLGGLATKTRNALLIGGPAPFVRPGLNPLSDLRGGTGARTGRMMREEGDGRGTAQSNSGGNSAPAGLQGTGTGTPRPVPPVHGLLALQGEQIEVLQGLEPDARGEDKKPAAGQLSDAEKEQVRELSRTDQEVRRHERAHAAAGGAIAGAPSYTYTQGPDGQRYAVNGEVSIDVSPVEGDPDATIQKMRQVKAAAMAPAQPSGQDRSVAAAADAISQQAQAELTAKATEEVTASEEPKDREAVGKPDAPGQPPSSVDPFPQSIADKGGDGSGPPRDIRPGSFVDISA